MILLMWNVWKRHIYRVRKRISQLVCLEKGLIVNGCEGSYWVMEIF